MTRKHGASGRRGPAARPAEPGTEYQRPDDESGAVERASTFPLELVAPVQGGQMLARLEGQVTFVSGGIPGEQVEAFIPLRKRGYLEAEARTLLRRSPDRVAPPCPYFGENGRHRGAIAQPSDDQSAVSGEQAGAVCGGCQYQHIAYERQVTLKGEIVRDVLRRVGKILEPPVIAPVPSPNSYAYRNKASWLVTPEGELAYRAARSHTAVPIARCPLLIPSLEAILEVVEGAAHEIGLGGLATGLEARVLPNGDGQEHGTLMLELAESTSPAEAQALAEALLELCPLVVGVAGARGHEAEPVILAGEPRLEAAFLNETLTVSATSFFQANLPLATIMARYVLEQCGTTTGREVLDVYAGVGTFTIPLAREANAVIAVELEPSAVADLRASAAHAGLDNLTLLEGDAAIALRSILPGSVDCVLIDPPRAGCTPDALRQLARIKAPRLVYVSCDAATLARDLRALLDQGYDLEAVRPFDLFPQTAHIENVATLRLPRKYQSGR